VIDLSASRVWRGKEEISLTPTEFRLLAYLARHPRQAISRGQLLEAVWGFTAEVESERTINVNIRRLREKIELDPGDPTLILTVPGVGYRLMS
jgi:DNA-binding response OmpR family regulator